MSDAEPIVGNTLDPLDVRGTFGGLEPVPARRASGAIFDSITLGRMEFVRMPPGRASFWFGQQSMPDSRHSLQIVCEVVGDNAPGVDHVASVISLRRNQVRDAAACLPLLNARLREMNIELRLAEDDLVLTAIYLRAQPLLDPCHELEYQVTRTPGLLVTVAFVYGVPLTIRVEREA